MTDEHGKDLAPRVPPPPPIDPEQLRRFEEFQRFQEFQRYQQQHGGATPPPPPPQPAQRKGKPLWLILLGSKLFRRLVYLLITLILVMWGYNHYFGSDDGGGVAVDSGGMTGNQVIRPAAPFGLQGTVGQLYKHVAHGDANKACLLLTDDAQRQFAQAHGAVDCPAAVRALKQQVTNVSEYERSGDSPPVVPTTDVARVSSCTELTVSGGPRLGELGLKKEGVGWAISSYAKSPCG